MVFIGDCDAFSRLLTSFFNKNSSGWDGLLDFNDIAYGLHKNTSLSWKTPSLCFFYQ